MAAAQNDQPYTPAVTVPGWYPDPSNPQNLRYWDGAQWTGAAFEPPPAPLASAPPPTAPPPPSAGSPTADAPPTEPPPATPPAAQAPKTTPPATDAKSAALAAPKPTPESTPESRWDFKWIAIVAVVVLGLVVAAAVSESADAGDKVTLPPVRDGKFEFTLLTWNGSGGKLQVHNIGNRAWSYNGDNQKAVDADGRRFDCEGGRASDLQPGATFTDTLKCRNGSVQIQHLRLHDSFLSNGAKLHL
ncbi:DUF2510 domain-containing protein [Mycolicibacterium sp.]|uniref:DUF2510 domain-containing protein n=1 Tax=Mycolicibacterium sp. TaxID=2320850 RepID=UPI00355FA655